jgi:hypothetical protein
MNKSPTKTPATDSDTPLPGYSSDLPASPEERERAVPEFLHQAAAEQKGKNPQDAETPFEGGSFNGTQDSSRFSTPPPDKT